MKNTKVKVSPTDSMERIYRDGDEPPEGFDICGRRVLSAEEHKGRFYQAMKNYRARTGLKIYVHIWSFPPQDLVGIDLTERPAGTYDAGHVIDGTAREMTPEEIRTRKSQTQRALGSISIPKTAAETYAEDPKYQAFREIADKARNK